MDIGGLEVGMVEEKDKKSAGVNIVNSGKKVGGTGDRICSRERDLHAKELVYDDVNSY